MSYKQYLTHSGSGYSWVSLSRIKKSVSPFTLTVIAFFTSITNTLWTQAEIFLISESIQAFPVVKARVTGAHILMKREILGI